MEDVGTDDIVGSGTDSEGPVREASTTVDEDEHLIYDQRRFRKDKIWRCFNLYYSRCRVIIERGV
jgi:hypothetical protein